MSRCATRQFTTISAVQAWWRGQNAPDPRQADSLASQSTLDISQDDLSESPLTRRIHLLGLGSIGTFVAHSLRCLPNSPPLTLLLHRPEMYDAFKKRGRLIRLINKKRQINDEQSGYDVDLYETHPETGTGVWTHIPSTPGTNEPPSFPITKEETMESGETIIHSLIVTVKGPNTVDALRNIKHRINADSTICLIQNGMGQVDELNEHVFTDPSTRPTYMLGIISHGVHLAGSFTAIHAGSGTTALGIVRDLDKFPLPPRTPLPSTATNALTEEDRKRMYPTDEDIFANVSSRYLLRTLTRSPILACAGFPYLDLLQLQLEKLAANCVINPLTALLNIPNGGMLYNRSLSRVQRLLIAEISAVIRGLPELEGLPNIRMRFSPERLETLAVGMASKTAENSSSMREDIRKVKETEIGYINGYIVKRGERQGIKCVLNYMILQLVMAKTWAQKSAEGESIPYGVHQLEGKMALGYLGKESGVVLEDKGSPDRTTRV